MVHCMCLGVWIGPSGLLSVAISVFAPFFSVSRTRKENGAMNVSFSCLLVTVGCGFHITSILILSSSDHRILFLDSS